MDQFSEAMAAGDRLDVTPRVNPPAPADTVPSWRNWFLLGCAVVIVLIVMLALYVYFTKKPAALASAPVPLQSIALATPGPPQSAYLAPPPSAPPQSAYSAPAPMVDDVQEQARRLREMRAAVTTSQPPTQLESTARRAPKEGKAPKPEVSWADQSTTAHPQSVDDVTRMVSESMDKSADDGNE